MIKKIRINKSKPFPSLLFIVVSIIAYFINIYYVAYQLTPWQDFGNIPIEPVRILNFIDKTPVWIGYLEPGTSKVFTCKEAIANLESEDGKTYRCCNSSKKASCVNKNDSDIRLTDEKCASSLSKIFGIPKRLPGTKDYKTFGYCPNSGNPEITVVQISDNQKIFWKSIKTLNLDIASFGLKCFVAPLFIVLALLGMMKNTKK